MSAVEVNLKPPQEISCLKDKAQFSILILRIQEPNFIFLFNKTQEVSGYALKGSEQSRCAPFSEEWQKLILVINQSGLHFSYHYHGQWKDFQRHLYCI